ncbi:hypothetical protein ACI2KR_07955 [Pseudomonas luteola]
MNTSLLELIRSTCNSQTLDGEPAYQARLVDKSNWIDGPWKAEPDLSVWIEPVSNLVCLISRPTLGGNLCGYVMLPEDHPWYGVRADKFPTIPKVRSINFANHFPPLSSHNADYDETIANSKGWWIGIDGMRSGDLSPWPFENMRELFEHDENFRIAVDRAMGNDTHSTYKGMAFMEEQCTLIALNASETMAASLLRN